MNLKRVKLKLKINTVVMLTIIFFGFVAVGLIYKVLLNNVSEKETVAVALNLKQKSEEINRILLTLKDLVETIAKDETFVTYLVDQKRIGKNEDINKKLANYNLNQNYLAIYLIGKDGITRASTDQSFMDQDYSFRRYFSQSIKGENYADVNLGVTSKKLGYYFSSPIKNDEEIVGVAVIKMDPEIVFSLINETDNVLIDNLMIVDRFGIVVGSIKEGFIYKSLGEIGGDNKEKLKIENKYPETIIDSLSYQILADELPYISDGKSFQITDKNSKVNEEIIVDKIGAFDFFLIGKINYERIVVLVKKMVEPIFWILMITIFLSMGTIVLVINNFFDPLDDLLMYSRKILAGDNDGKSNIKGNDELAELGQNIEVMAETIKHRYDELEKMVEDRTTKLKEQSESMKETKLVVDNILNDVENVALDLEKYKMAVENASDHIVITDPEGMVLYVNKAVEKITGFGRYQTIGKKAGNKELWGGKMGLDFYQKMWKTIKTDKMVFEGEVNNVRKNGQEYVAKVSVSPVLDNKGDVLYFVGIERDITREKEVDRGKTDFIYLTSHQLRTPLSAMRWFCDMLLAGDAGKLTKQQSEFVTNISQSNERMIDLINSLLNISRIESGRIIIDPTPTDLGKLVQDVLGEIDNKIQEKKQKVSVNVGVDIPKINIDPKLIREVYKNLLTNANKYTQEGGEISILVSRKDEEIVSEISDNGFGIPIQDQPHVFERFYRADNIVKLETEGTGLGLYLAKAIVESSNGKIWFQSREGKGTNFWFSLPVSGVKEQKGQVSISSS
ncbi:MAG: ATP-binding protein [Candidatus Shapirobacteria bacterium]